MEKYNLFSKKIADLFGLENATFLKTGSRVNLYWTLRTHILKLVRIRAFSGFSEFGDKIKRLKFHIWSDHKKSNRKTRSHLFHFGK